MASQIISVPFTYQSADKKTTIHAKLWTNELFGAPNVHGVESPKGLIQIVHGMAEHIDRYDDLAAHFVSNGFVVCAHNHIGHGGSVASKNDYGHMPVQGGKEILIADTRKAYEKIRDIFPSVPYVIYGHSMGSFVTRIYITRYGKDLSACVLSGTGNVPAALSRLGRSLARTIAKFKGETHHSKMVDNMGVGAYAKQIENARTALDWLSTDEEEVNKYIDDEQCGFMFTVGGYATLLDMTAEVVTPECAAKVPHDLPVLFIAGDNDPVGNMGEGVKAAAQLLKDAQVKDVEVMLYEGMRHEVHNEIGYKQVYKDVTSWIERHIS